MATDDTGLQKQNGFGILAVVPTAMQSGSQFAHVACNFCATGLVLNAELDTEFGMIRAPMQTSHFHGFVGESSNVIPLRQIIRPDNPFSPIVKQEKRNILSMLISGPSDHRPARSLCGLSLIRLMFFRI